MTGDERLSKEEVTADSPYTIPGFFDALADGTLYGIRCRSCEEQLVPPRPACYACGSTDVDLAEQPMSGTVYTYTAVHAPAAALREQAPFTVAVVELDSGARLTGRVDATYDETAIGMPVRVRTRALEPPERELSREFETDWPLHVFEPI